MSKEITNKLPEPDQEAGRILFKASSIPRGTWLNTKDFKKWIVLAFLQFKKNEFWDEEERDYLYGQFGGYSLFSLESKILGGCAYDSYKEYQKYNKQPAEVIINPTHSSQNETITTSIVLTGELK